MHLRLVPLWNTRAEQAKTKDHPIKNILLVHALLTLPLLRSRDGGRVHDKRLAEATPYPFPTGNGLLQDLGFLTFTLPHVAILMPRKQPRGEARTLEEKLATQALHARLRLWQGAAAIW